MEEKLVPAAGFDLVTLPGSGLSRKLNLAGIKKNLNAVKCVVTAVGKCKKIIRDFGADVIVGTGGYASFPALLAGSQLKIPTIVHEANAVPGLTTKLAAGVATRVLVCFEESRKYYKKPDEVEVVGMPVRPEFFCGNKAAARAELGIADDKPLLVSAFGSLGAKVMNETMADMMPLAKADGFPFHHIHATGSFGKEWMPQRVKDNGVDYETEAMLDIREYIYNMPTVMAAADVIIGRAGSATCNEIAAAGVPCILIPSPNVTNNHQEKNARVLEEAGGAVVVLEKDCSPEQMYGEVKALLADDARREKMAEALRGLARTDSAQRICDLAEELANR
jgi:UDP-N-acetylglucosamine--N-acetylmuramyl-(pentapeptide) pyrophosphoryl-undecaprenol N-acetylglucosamine transferase